MTARTAAARRWKKQDAQNKLNYIREFKARPCVDCGVEYGYWVMACDHRDPASKEYAITDLHKRSWATIKAELAKCDVRCANCHLDLTYR